MNDFFFTVIGGGSTPLPLRPCQQYKTDRIPGIRCTFTFPLITELINQSVFVLANVIIAKRIIFEFKNISRTYLFDE